MIREKITFEKVIKKTDNLPTGRYKEFSAWLYTLVLDRKACNRVATFYP